HLGSVRATPVGVRYGARKMDGQSIVFTVQYVELLTSLMGSQRSAGPSEDLADSRAERWSFLAPSPQSSPVALGLPVAEVVEVPCLGLGKSPKSPSPTSPQSVGSLGLPGSPQALSPPTGPRVMLPPGAIKPHSEYQARKPKRKITGSMLPRPPQANTLLGRLSLF
ncbi:unnamed protein product, partial [Effrenium voratum]